jgi:hypothetical protein
MRILSGYYNQLPRANRQRLPHRFGGVALKVKTVRLGAAMYKQMAAGLLSSRV